jgi:hypothetical protein
MLTVLAQRFDGLAKRNRPLVIERSTLFGSCQARAVLGGLGRHSRKAHIAEQ